MFVFGGRWEDEEIKLMLFGVVVRWMACSFQPSVVQERGERRENVIIYSRM